MEMMITCLFSSLLTLLLLNNVKLITSTTVFDLTTDQSALLALKKSITLDPHNVLINNWTTNTPTCSWIGVSCSVQHRRITAVNISGHQLQGAIAPDLGNLTFLRSLDVSLNNLTGEIPSGLGALPRLQYINLRNNSFSGSIPNAIFNLSLLKEIDVRFNQFSGKLPDYICSNTPKLKNMSLAGNQFYGEIPANISKCREMEGLQLGYNMFDGSIASEIGSLTMLKYLNLRSNQFTGSIPSAVFNISSLINMDLRDNKLSGTIPTDIPYNSLHIQNISLSRNNLTGGIPRQFGNLSSLFKLEFPRNNLTGALPEELGNLANLRIFAAPYNRLSGPIPSSIFNISSLIEFWVQENLLSGSIPSDMGLSIFTLQKLILHYNRFTGEIPAALTNATQLTNLELNRNSLTGRIPNFGNLRLLQTLRLWENQLTGADSPTQEMEFITSLTNCRDLQFLEISYNQLNGVLPSSIGNFSSSIFRIWASFCNINGGIPSEIGKLSSLRGLRLSGNRLSGALPETMRNLTQLQEILFGGNQLQGYIPDYLCQMTDLGVLNLSHNMLTGPINECFGDLRSLRQVYFEFNRLNSTIPYGFWSLSVLTMLDLSSNQLTGRIPSQIGSWNAINQLDLSSNQFSGDVPNSIGDCKSLEYLSLSNNKFGGSIPDTLGEIGGLKTLNLSNNELSGLIPKSLEDLRVLEDFDVSYNRLEGEIPDGIPNSTAQSFVHNSALCGAPRFQVPSCRHGRSRSKSIAFIFLKYVLPSFAAATILVVVAVVVVRRRRELSPPATDQNPFEKLARRRISETEIAQGTTSFSETNLLGMGSFGKVYKATLSDGLNYAVKVFNSQLEGAIKSFDIESKILSSIRHRNLLPVISCCTNINTEFRALILEYMPNGSLDKWLHSDTYFLDLTQRLTIATDVALALEYLHHGHTFPVVHCDIKPSNVLLHEDMTAHVGDFGISKLFSQGEAMTHTTTMATIGYAAPEFGSEGKVSTNGDVYSYGILLLEMFTDKKPTDDMFSEEMSLKDWVKAAVEEDAIISKVVAPGLVSGEDRHASAKEQCLSSVFDTAMNCLTFLPDQRPNMIQVAAELNKIKAKVITAADRGR